MTRFCKSNWNSHWEKLRPPAKRFHFQQVTCKAPFPAKGAQAIPDSLNRVQITCRQKRMIFLPAKLLSFFNLRFEEERDEANRPVSWTENTRFHCFPSKKMPPWRIFPGPKADHLEVIPTSHGMSHVISRYVPRFPLAPGWLQCFFVLVPINPS